MKKKKGMVVANHHFWIKTTIRTGKLWHTSEEKMICVIWLVLLQLHKLKKNWSVWSGLHYQQPCISFYTKELTKAMSNTPMFKICITFNLDQSHTMNIGKIITPQGFNQGIWYSSINKKIYFSSEKDLLREYNICLLLVEFQNEPLSFSAPSVLLQCSSPLNQKHTPISKTGNRRNNDMQNLVICKQ